MNKLSSTIIDLIHKSKYHEAKKWFDQLSQLQQRDLVITEASLTDNICIIGFMEFLISNENSYYNHMLAAEVYDMMCWVEGAYYVAYYHATECYRLEPDDIETKKFLLSFYDLPEITEEIMPESFAIELSTVIHQAEPDYAPAIEILQGKMEK